MKIKNVQQAAIQIEKDMFVDGRKTGTDNSLEFKRRITALKSENYERHIKDIIDKISDQGEIVAKKANIVEFQKYRELITQLLNETASNSYEFSKLNKIDSRGKHKAFAIIKKVNQKLDEMAQAILNEQSANIQMMNMVDDIRGMLVDLYL